MTQLTLTKLRMCNGIWEWRISAADRTREPDIRVTYLDRPVTDVTLCETDTAGSWDISIAVPSHAVADGVQTFVILDAESGTKLGDFSLIAGEAVSDDLRAEVELLRAELDMLKRAFRRHCLETT